MWGSRGGKGARREVSGKPGAPRVMAYKECWNTWKERWMSSAPETTRTEYKMCFLELVSWKSVVTVRRVVEMIDIEARIKWVEQWTWWQLVETVEKVLTTLKSLALRKRKSGCYLVRDLRVEVKVSLLSWFLGEGLGSLVPSLVLS